MTANKTTPTSQSVDEFLATLDDPQQIADSRELVAIMQSVSGQPPVMWGGAIVGFGSAALTYASGRTVDWPLLAFSPRKGKLTLYLTVDAAGLTSQFPRLSTYKIAKGCIYLRRLADVDNGELRKLISHAAQQGYLSPTRADGKEQIVKVDEV